MKTIKNSKRFTSVSMLGKQKGFAAAVFLVIALISIVIAALAYMSRGYTSGVTEQSAKVNSSVIMKQASDFKDGFDRMLITTGISAATVLFDNTSPNGLFNPAAGAQYSIKNVPPASAVATGTTPEYTYNQGVVLPGVGTAAADFVVTLGDINEKTCLAINRALYNDAPNAAPASSAGDLADWTTAPTAVADGANVATNYVGRAEGCIATGDSKFVYYKALAEN